jgi:4-aminobutyrate aminotransferase-like enzyme
MTVTDVSAGPSAVYYPVSDVRMVAGDGIYLVDAEGRSYIDCASGTFNLSLGYRHPAVVRAVREQAEQLIHVTSGFQTGLVNRLAARLVELAPAGLTRAHLKVCGGSTANEGAVKMAQRATGRWEVVTLFRGHHGQTMAMTGLSGNAFRRAVLPPGAGAGLKVPDPYCLRCFYGQDRATCGLMCVDRIGDFLEFASSGSVAAVLIEPVSGNGGNIVPPEGYFARLRELCDAHGLMLIVDEVQTGIGRTGRMFAAEHWDLRPDAMTLGKGLGGSGAPVAAILASDALAGLPAADHAFTHGANLLSAAAALATLEVVDDPVFLANVRATGSHILTRLRQVQAGYRCVGDVRGLGLMIGVEIVTDRGAPDPGLANELAAQAMGVGLVLRTSRYGRGNVVKIRPPLILTVGEADLICDRFEALLAARR